MKEKVILFCQKNCCPVVKIRENDVVLGDEKGPEGITVWSKPQFNDFIKAVKEGKITEIDE